MNYVLYFLLGFAVYVLLMWLDLHAAAAWFCGLWLGLFSGATFTMYVVVDCLADGPDSRYYGRAYHLIMRSIARRRAKR